MKAKKLNKRLTAAQILAEMRRGAARRGPRAVEAVSKVRLGVSP